jgi:hypothetical protein
MYFNFLSFQISPLEVLKLEQIILKFANRKWGIYKLFKIVYFNLIYKWRYMYMYSRILEFFLADNTLS